MLSTKRSVDIRFFRAQADDQGICQDWPRDPSSSMAIVAFGPADHISSLCLSFDGHVLVSSNRPCRRGQSIFLQRKCHTADKIPDDLLGLPHSSHQEPKQRLCTDSKGMDQGPMLQVLDRHQHLYRLTTLWSCQYRDQRHRVSASRFSFSTTEMRLMHPVIPLHRHLGYLSLVNIPNHETDWR